MSVATHPAASTGADPPPRESATVAGPDPAQIAAARETARRLAGGGTLWCVVPGTPGRAHRMAVTMADSDGTGRPPLPAVAADGTGLDQLRRLVRRGDVLLAAGSGDDPDLVRVLRRGAPWGVLTVLLCEGRHPAPGTADHVLGADWTDRDGGIPRDAGDAGATATLRVLRELVREALDEPFVHAPPGGPCTDVVCITCSDEGRVVEVLEVAGGDRDRRARVLAEGSCERVDVSLVGPVGKGDLLLVHAGVALAVLSEVAG